MFRATILKFRDEVPQSVGFWIRIMFGNSSAACGLCCFIYQALPALLTDESRKNVGGGEVLMQTSLHWQTHG